MSLSRPTEIVLDPFLASWKFLVAPGLRDYGNIASKH